MTISPLVAGTRPDTSIISVLFPQPDGPTIETNSPAAMSKETLSTRLQRGASSRRKYLFHADNADERFCTTAANSLLAWP